MGRAVFVTGTGTDVGKTYVSAALVQRFEAAYWKPVASGTRQGRDVQTVAKLTGLPVLPEVYAFRAPLSPHLAAQREGRRVRPEAVLKAWATLKSQPRVVVEGAGGLLVPLTAGGYMMADLMKALGLPVLVVGHAGLGTINHTLLTLEALRQRSLTVVGVVLNGRRNRDNENAIERFGQVPVVGTLAVVGPGGLRRAARNLDRHGLLEAHFSAKEG